MPNAALQFFGSGDKRFYIDPTKRLESCNKGATQQAQKLLARATASLGCDPRTPGAFAMEQVVQKPTPRQQQLDEQMYRAAWAFEQFLASRGIDMSKAPTLPPQVPAPAASPEEVAFGSDASAYLTGLARASGTVDEQGATQGDPEGDAEGDAEGDDEGAGLGEDANRDGGDDRGDDGGDDGDGDNTPPPPTSPGEMRATQRRASTRARKAPRRF